MALPVQPLLGCVEVTAEEGNDAVTGICRRRFVEAGGPIELPHDDEDRWGLRRRRQGKVIEERVSGVRVLLDVMVDTESLQGSVEPLGSPSVSPVLCTVAADDGTGARQDALDVGVLGHPYAVVHAGHREPVVEGEQQREPASDAEADDPDLTRATILVGQPGPYGFDVLE